MADSPANLPRFVQVRDLLDQVRDFHGQLAGYYHGLSDRAAMARVSLLLDYMSSHEKNLQASLAAFEEGASRQVMDTWVDGRHCEEIIATCKQTPLAPDLSVDGVTQVALDVDACLTHFYQEVATKAETESVREVFGNLISMEQSELRTLARNALLATDF